MKSLMDRRTFFAGMTGLSGTLWIAPWVRAAEGLASKPMPRRVLGRTKQEVSMLGLGTAPMGHAYVGEEIAVPAIHAALDQGINYIDTALIYDDAQAYVGKVTPTRRDEMFLITKTWADTWEKAEESLTSSLKVLRTDHVDLCHIHCIGALDPKKVIGERGCLAYLLNAKEKGLTRFVGMTGHNRISYFPEVLNTGEIDVMMVVLNFVDCHLYDFHNALVPLAKKHSTAVVAMKVFGGRGKEGQPTPWGQYRRPGPSQMPKDLLQDALRYALSLDGVDIALTGVYNGQEIVQNAGWAKEFKPLTAEEMKSLEEKGKQMSADWGTRFGEPV
ncbi:MAG TPA: aldo/keto reductase [bacterium]|nr:aldo/keto reductase [bacterium]